MSDRYSKVIDVLRGTAPAKLRKRAPNSDIAVHVLGQQDCIVQVGSRIVLSGATYERAVEEAEGQKRRLAERGITARIIVHET